MLVLNLDKEYDLFNKWLNNRDDYELCLEVYNNIDYNRHKYLQDLILMHWLQRRNLISSWLLHQTSD